MLRLGKPTASAFEKIVTPAKGDLSKQSRKYAYYLIAEELIGEPLESIDHLEWVARGKIMEPQAVQQYEFTNDVTAAATGFITSDDGRMGASPDRLIGTIGGLELKCPSPQVHVEYMMDGPGADYKPQIQGQLYVCEFEWVDFYSFHPSMPPVQIRTYRDEEYIKKLASALQEFCDMKDEMLLRAKASGFFEERKVAREPLQAAAEQWKEQEEPPNQW